MSLFNRFAVISAFAMALSGCTLHGGVSWPLFNPGYGHGYGGGRTVNYAPQRTCVQDVPVINRWGHVIGYQRQHYRC